MAVALLDYATHFVMGCVGSKTKTVKQSPANEDPLVLAAETACEYNYFRSCVSDFIFLVVKCTGYFNLFFQTLLIFKIIYLLEIGLCRHTFMHTNIHMYVCPYSQ